MVLNSEYCVMPCWYKPQLIVCVWVRSVQKELIYYFYLPFSVCMSCLLLTLLFSDPPLSLRSFRSLPFPLSVCLYPSSSLCQRVPQSPALPYVTGAHIRENNLWPPWIRDAVEFPMIQVWYGNSLKYLDSGGLSDQCSSACCWPTHVSETSCQEDPWDQSRAEEMEQLNG